MKQETFLAATKLEETVSIISCRFLTPTSLPPKGTVLQAHYDSILSTNVTIVITTRFNFSFKHFIN